MRIAVAAAAAAATTLTLVSAVQAQTASWNIDPAHSRAGFAVRHMMVTTVRGEFGKMSGAIEFDGNDLRTVKADATIDATTINTNEPKRDAHLKSGDFFDVEKFPTITFKSKRVEGVGDGRFKLVGELTMRGVTKELALDVEGPTRPITDQRGTTRVGATATARINRQDYGVSWSRALDNGGVVVSDEVTITIDLALVKAKPAATSN